MALDKKIILVFSLLNIALFSIIFLFSAPYFDDYCHAYDIKTNGLIESMYWFYYNWSGRFTSHLILSAHPLLLNSVILYKFVLFVYFIIFSLSIFYFSSSYSSSNVSGIGFSFWFLCAVFLFSPGLGDAILWLPGSIVYSLSLASLILFYCLVRVLLKEPSKLKLGKMALAFSLALFLPGFNEILIGFVFILMFHFAPFNPLNGAENKKSIEYAKIFYSILFLVVFGSCIALLAPGNFARADVFETKFDIMITLKGGLKSIFLQLSNYLLMPAFLSFIAISFVLFYKYAVRSYKFDLNLALMLFLFWVSGHFPSFILNYFPPPRLEHFLFVLFLIFILYLVFGIAYYVEKVLKFKFRESFLRYHYALLLIVFSSPNFIAHVSDIVDGTYLQFNHSLNERNILLNDKSQKSVVFNGLSKIPLLFDFIDITDNGSNQINACYSKFYNKNEVKIR